MYYCSVVTNLENSLDALLYTVIILTKNALIRKQERQLINMLMGSIFIIVKNAMQVSMFPVQNSVLPKGVGLLSRTLRKTGHPPET